MKRIQVLVCIAFGCSAGILVHGEDLATGYTVATEAIDINTTTLSYDSIGIIEKIAVDTLIEETGVDDSEGAWFVEYNATFQGGDLNSFSKWAATQIKYPVEASMAKIKGKVFVQFSVNRWGKVVDVKVVRGVHPLLDNEVVRVIKMSPDWTPATQKGKPVKQNFVIPVAFTF